MALREQQGHLPPLVVRGDLCSEIDLHHDLVVVDESAWPVVWTGQEVGRLSAWIFLGHAGERAEQAQAAGAFVLHKPFYMGSFITQVLRLRVLSMDPAQALSRLGALQFDPLQRQCVVQGSGQVIRLTEKETEIIIRLLREKGEVVNKADLLVDVWGYEDGVDTHTLETHIYQLRRKLTEPEAVGVHIISDQGGYALRGERS